MSTGRSFGLVATLLALGACEESTPPPPYHPAPLPEPRPTELTAAPASTEIAIGADQDAYADTDPSALTDFRASLDGHGAWAEDATWGTVWVPNVDEVGADFTPYVTAGHWVYEDDWIWVSDWSWGWAPFHYGRWVFVEGRGWCWIPGRVYAGAWVVWELDEDDGDWIAWAPMAPVWIWRGGFAVAFGFAPPRPHFVVCRRGNVFEPRLRDHVVGGERAAPMLGRMRPFERPGHVVPPWHPIPQPPMHGPAPHIIGIEPSRVPRALPSDPGVSRAREFARPSTALPSGARPPTTHPVTPRFSPPPSRRPHR